MKKKAIWLVVTSLIVVAPLLVSCALTVAEEEEEEEMVTEREVVEEDVIPSQPSTETPSQPELPQIPATGPITKGTELKVISPPDFYLIRIIGGEQQDQYLAEISPEFDSTFNEAKILRLTYASSFSERRIGEPYYFEGALRTPAIIGEFFEIKGTISLSSDTLEITSYKQNVYYKQAFQNYREALFIQAQAYNEATEAKVRYNTIFDTLLEGKCVYHTAYGIPPEPSPSMPSGSSLVTPLEKAQEVERKYNHINSKVISLDILVDEIDELVIHDCREDIIQFLEDRDSATSILNRIDTALSEVKTDLSTIREILESIMSS